MALPLVGAAWGVMALIGGAVAKMLSVETVKFVATRAMMYTLFTIVLPVVLYNVFTRILYEIIEYINAELAGSGMDGTMVQLTGMGAWIADQIQLPLAMSIFLSAVSLRWVISIIKR